MAETRSLGLPRRDLTTIVALLLIGSAVAMLATITGGRAVGTDVWMVILLALIMLSGVDRPELGVYLLAFAIPFEFFFFGWGTGRYQMLAYPAVALAGYWSVTRRRFLGRIRGHEACFIVLLVWAAVSLMWMPDNFQGIRSLFSLAGSFAFMYVIPRAVTTKDGALRILGFFAAGLLIYSVILSFNYERTVWIEQYGKMYLSQFGAAEEVSPYEYGNACAVAVFGCLGLWEFSRSKAARRIGLILAVLFIGGLLLTLSRAFMVELTAAMLAWILLTRARRGLRIRLLVGAALVALGLGVALSVNAAALDFRMDLTLSSLQHDDMISATSGRTGIWGVGWELVRARPVTGSGVGSFGQAYAEFTATTERGDHSSVIGFMVELGVPGLLLFVGFLGALGVAAWRAGRWRPVTMAWWTYFVIEAFLNGHARNKAAWMAVGLIALLSAQASRSTKAEEVRVEDAPPASRPLAG